MKKKQNITVFCVHIEIQFLETMGYQGRKCAKGRNPFCDSDYGESFYDIFDLLVLKDILIPSLSIAKGLVNQGRIKIDPRVQAILNGTLAS